MQVERTIRPESNTPQYPLVPKYSSDSIAISILELQKLVMCLSPKTARRLLDKTSEDRIVGISEEVTK
jgi:hypothetical protein